MFRRCDPSEFRFNITAELEDVAESSIRSGPAPGWHPEARLPSFFIRAGRHREVCERPLVRGKEGRPLANLPQELGEKIRALNDEVAAFAVGHLIDDLRKKYLDLPEVVSFFDRIQADVIKTWTNF